MGDSAVLVPNLPSGFALVPSQGQQSPAWQGVPGGREPRPWGLEPVWFVWRADHSVQVTAQSLAFPQLEMANL